MDTPLVVSRPQAQLRRPSLRMITIAALVLNALVFTSDLIASGPNGLNLGHIIPPLVFAGLVAIRRRWTPALGALLGAVWLQDAFIFLTDMLVQPDAEPSGAAALLVAAPHGALGTADRCLHGDRLPERFRDMRRYG
jgi:hypothetical protein